MKPGAVTILSSHEVIEYVKAVERWSSQPSINNVVVTEEREIRVYFIGLDSPNRSRTVKRLRSIQISSDLRLCSPVKCLELPLSARNFYAIVEDTCNGRVGIWSCTDTEIQKEENESMNATMPEGNIKKFDFPIFSVEISPTRPYDLLLINGDGGISLITNDLTRIRDEYNPPRSQTVRWCTLFSPKSSFLSSSFSSKDVILLTLSSSKLGDNSHSVGWLDFYHIRCKKGAVDLWASLQVEDEANFISCGFHPSLGQLSVIDQAGVWKIYRIHCYPGKNATPYIDKASGAIVLPLGGFLPFSLANHQTTQKKSLLEKQARDMISIRPLGYSYWALLGARKVNDTDVEHVLTIWDGIYFTLQTEHIVGVSERIKHVLASETLAYQLLSTPLESSHLILATQRSTPNSELMNITIHSCQYVSEKMTMLHAVDRMKYMVKYFGIDPNDRISGGQGFTRSGFDAVGHLDCTPPDFSQTILQNYKTTLTQLENLESHTLNNMLSSLNPDEFTKYFMEYVDTKTREAKQTFQIRYSLSERDMKIYEEEMMERVQVNGVKKRGVKRSNSDANGGVGKGDEEEDETMRNNGGKTDAKVSKNRFKAAMTPMLSHRFILTTLSKCFTRSAEGKPRSDFFSASVIKYLIEHNLLYDNAVDGGIIEALVALNNWHLLRLTVLSVRDISERSLISLIKHAIASSKKDHGKNLLLQRCLSLALCKPRNKMLMRYSLQELTVREMVDVFKTLVKWFGMSMKNEETKGGILIASNEQSMVERAQKNSLPRLEHILEFLSLLLDAHFTTVILSPSLHPFLTSLNEYTSSELSKCQLLQKLHGHLYDFHRKHVKRQKNKGEKKLARKAFVHTGGIEIPSYSIEVFKL
ncbi:6772_t:CDS:10 [Paraglomus occultum]|uniref:6772_t:CDS:1 n=1 Tax=Paraglomus occultum TaxID=144539 RepID=A0A9N8YTZ1_9GLOM|nr:6772_t:CDS:10 [Paraglomus occultum]